MFVIRERLYAHPVYVCIPRSFLVINVCNQGKTLCSPCSFVIPSKCLKNFKDLKIPVHMLENTWREIDYRLDVLRATKGAHVEVY